MMTRDDAPGLSSPRRIRAIASKLAAAALLAAALAGLWRLTAAPVLHETRALAEEHARLVVERNRLRALAHERVALAETAATLAEDPVFRARLSTAPDTLGAGSELRADVETAFAEAGGRVRRIAFLEETALGGFTQLGLRVEGVADTIGLAKIVETIEGVGRYRIDALDVAAARGAGRADQAALLTVQFDVYAYWRGAPAAMR